MATTPAFPPKLPNSTPYKLSTENDLSGGVNQDQAQDAIADNEALYIQDGLVNNKGRIYKRGAISRLSGYAAGSVGEKIDGLASFISPSGNLSYASLINDNATYKLRLANSVFTSSATFNTLIPALYADTDAILDANPAQGGEMLLGISKRYSADVASGNDSRAMYRWKGASKPNYSTGTASCTLGTAAVTGAGTLWLANVEPGMYLLVGSVYYGIVKSVNSDTSITLEQNILGGTITANVVTWTSLIGFPTVPEKTVGRITASNASAIINGGATKFISQAVGVGDDVLTIVADQPVRLGFVASVQSDTQLTLSANSTQNCVNAKYFIRASGSSTQIPRHPPMGFLNAYWNGMQFFGNKDARGTNSELQQLATIWVTDSNTIQGIDLTRDGSSLTLPQVNTGNFLTGLFPTETGLIVWRENETYLIQGSSPDTLKAHKIASDGCYGSTTAASYKGGAIWAGRKGIYAFDGSSVVSLLDNKALKYYADCIGAQALDSYRWHGFVQQDHYFLHTAYQTLIHTTAATGDVTSFLHQVWVINLKTGALTFFTNMNATGATTIPGTGTVFVQRFGTGASLQGEVCAAADVFGANLGVTITFGDDTHLSNEWTVQTYAPQILVEGKLYSAGQPELKKKWKQLQFWQNTTSNLRLDVFSGLDKTAVATNVVVTALSVWKNIRFAFAGNSSHIGFRLSQAQVNSGPISIGAFALMWKPQRIGRV